MAYVRKQRTVKSAAGYSDHKGNQESTEERAALMAREMLRQGKRRFNFCGLTFVLCGGEFVEWGKADPRLIGK